MPFGGGLLGELLTAGVAAVAGLLHGGLERVAFGVDDIAQPAGDVVVDTAEVVVLECLAALLAQLLEHLAHALQALAVLGLEALLHHASERGVDIAVVEQIVGDLAEDVGGIEVEADLRAIPAGVSDAVALSHVRTVPGILRR